MKTTLSVSIEEELSVALRLEAERQRRPLSWVVSEALAAGLPKAHRGKRGAVATVATTDAEASS